MVRPRQDQQAARRGLDLGAAGVEVALEHDLGGQLVAERLAFLTRQAGVEQALLGLDRGVALVEIEDRPLGDAGQPVAERAGRSWRAGPRGRWCASGRPTTIRSTSFSLTSSR